MLVMIKQFSLKFLFLLGITPLCVVLISGCNNKDFEVNQISIIKDIYTKVGKENNVLVIPVGLAFDIAYKELPEIKLHHNDGTHPNLKGTYLAACTVFASIYGESPIGLKYDYYGAINKDDKKLLQEIAHKATFIYLNE